MFKATTPSTDPALWKIQRRFGPAGGPDEVVLTDEGLARAFSVGARVRRGPAADALEALANAGGQGLLIEMVGAACSLTPIGRFDQIAWGHLRSLGYVESFDRDGVRLTAAGRVAVADGLAERFRLLDRCRRAMRQAELAAHTSEMEIRENVINGVPGIGLYVRKGKN